MSIFPTQMMRLRISSTSLKYIKSAHFIIAEIPADTIIKSFVPDHPDRDLRDCTVRCTLDGNKLLLHIGRGRVETVEVKPVQAAEVPLYSYEDLELFKSAPTKERRSVNNVAETAQPVSVIVGEWQQNHQVHRPYL